MILDKLLLIPFDATRKRLLSGKENLNVVTLPLCLDCFVGHVHGIMHTWNILLSLLASVAKELVVGVCGGELLRKRRFQNVPEMARRLKMTSVLLGNII